MPDTTSNRPARPTPLHRLPVAAAILALALPAGILVPARATSVAAAAAAPVAAASATVPSSAGSSPSHNGAAAAATPFATATTASPGGTTTTTTTTTVTTTAGAGSASLQVLPPFEIPALHRTRTVRVWLPPSYGTAVERRYPVVYLHDGQNVFSGPGVPWGGWGVDEAMAELARTRGFEAIVVAIDHGGEHRLSEMSPWPDAKQLPVEGPAYLGFIVDIVKPYVDAHYRTQPGRESTAMVGSSLGALVTQDALLRYPRVFGKAALFSPAYWFTPSVVDQTRAHPWPAGTRTYFYAGGKESEDMVPDLDRMMSVLSAQQHLPQDIALHVEPLAVHDERAWRAEFPRAVAWLFQLPPVVPSSPAASSAAAPTPAR